MWLSKHKERDLLALSRAVVDLLHHVSTMLKLLFVRGALSGIVFKAKGR